MNLITIYNKTIHVGDVLKVISCMNQATPALTLIGKQVKVRNLYQCTRYKGNNKCLLFKRLSCKSKGIQIAVSLKNDAWVYTLCTCETEKIYGPTEFD